MFTDSKKHFDKQIMISGNYFDIIKPDILILTANKTSFNTFLALSEEVNKNNFNYIFIESSKNVKNGNLIILNDFCLNPNIMEILKALNKGLYRSHIENQGLM